MKIASHNSGTGMTSRNLLSLLVIPFARCQTKSIVEQYESGVRYFDFRIKNCKNNSWCFAHGLWESVEDPKVQLSLLNQLCSQDNCTVYIEFTYEGSLNNEDKKEFLQQVENLCETNPNIKPTRCVVRKPSWEILKTWDPQPLYYCFKPINFTNKRWLLPIPWIWNKFFPIKPNEEKSWQFYDFI